MPGSQVETYSGIRLHERPRRFLWEGNWLEVCKVLDQGRSPDALWFKVAADDRRVYHLKYRFDEDAWEIRPAGKLNIP